MPLVIAPLNQILKVIKILADEKSKKHLESLGITVDSELQVLASQGGSLILKIKDGRLAIDHVLATKIIVTA
ncbi:MAG: ferrous iron transport protein A [Acholeplasmatales bacterium]|nr:ferrous iron transport protein A [Acholeplasmatales bacterium]